jgi:hypothetical protein
VFKEPFAAMTNDSNATTFVFDVIAAAPAADVETETSGQQAEATLTGATVSSPAGGDNGPDLRLDGLDPIDVPGGVEAGDGEPGPDPATVTLASGEAAAGHVVLGHGAGALTVDFVDLPPAAG